MNTSALKTRLKKKKKKKKSTKKKLDFGGPIRKINCLPVLGLTDARN